MSLRPLACVLVAASLGVAPPAQATAVCMENNSLTFSPPLTLANQIGSVTLQYENTCGDAPLLTPSHSAGTVVFGYFGSCALTIFTEPLESVMVAGVLYVYIRGDFVKIQILQPSSLCPGPVTTAHGTGLVVAT